MKATYDQYNAAPDPLEIKRFWTRTTYWNDNSTVDTPAISADEALAHAREMSRLRKADVDAMDGAEVMATFRDGEKVY